MISIEELVEEASGLVSMPQVALQVTRLVEDPNSSAEDIAEAIAREPALAARILRLANSPLYGMRSEVDTVSRAVTVLGTLQVRDLVLASAAVHGFDGIPNELVTMEDFWRHSLYTGLASRRLARLMLAGREESSFIAGLLHDIGKLVLYHRCPQQVVQAFLAVINGEQERIDAAERALLGFDHAELGGALMAHWALPEHLVAAARYHHRPLQAPERFRREAMRVHVANHIAQMAQLDTTRPGDVPPVEPAAWEALGLSPLQVPELVQAVQEEVVEVEEALFRREE